MKTGSRNGKEERGKRKKSRPLTSLRFTTTSDYSENLSTLIGLIEQTPGSSIVVAPEVCLSNFDYEHFEAAASFTPKALDALFAILGERTLIITLIERRSDGIYNVAKVLHKGKVIHEQAKAHLFEFGGEHDYFSEGSDDEIVLFEVDDIKMGIIICFELRFKQLWKKLEGADIIAIPAQWGKLRSDNFVTLTEALAIINQCYVVASDTSNDDMTGQSGIITPFGVAARNGNEPCLSIEYDEKEVRKMRRYMDVGIAK